MRNHIAHKYSDGLMLGGDGLTYMRLIHRLAQDPRRYLSTTPVIIPQLGEHPHGTHHVLHGGWRLWWPLIKVCAKVVNNKQVCCDPNVSDFNEHEHFLRIMTRALSEYVVEISNTGSSFRHVDRFLAAAAPNLAFSYVCNFLHLYAFMFLQMRNAVRQNQSSTLDLIWCENLSIALTAAANKTNYSVMSVIRVYWGYAVVAPLATAYHAVRSLRLIHTHVGWDMFIEYMNLLIRQGLTTSITKDSIRTFIQQLNFTAVVNRGLEAIIQRLRSRDEATLKNIDHDVALIKEFLRSKIGTTWAQATQPSDANVLGVDLSDWGGRRAARQQAPWEQMRWAMTDYREWVRDQVAKLCPWHHWL